MSGQQRDAGVAYGGVRQVQLLQTGRVPHQLYATAGAGPSAQTLALRDVYLADKVCPPAGTLCLDGDTVLHLELEEQQGM